MKQILGMMQYLISSSLQVLLSLRQELCKTRSDSSPNSPNCKSDVQILVIYMARQQQKKILNELKYFNWFD